MVVLDCTIVNVALPSIQRALSFKATDIESVVNAHSLAFGGLQLLGGRAGDLFGRRRMFIGGVLAGFVVALLVIRGATSKAAAGGLSKAA